MSTPRHDRPKTRLFQNNEGVNPPLVPKLQLGNARLRSSEVVKNLIRSFFRTRFSANWSSIVDPTRFCEVDFWCSVAKVLSLRIFHILSASRTARKHRFTGTKKCLSISLPRMRDLDSVSKGLSVHWQLWRRAGNSRSGALKTLVPKQELGNEFLNEFLTSF